MIARANEPDLNEMRIWLEKASLQQSSAIFIDTNNDTSAVVQQLEGLPVNPPSLYVDLEGVNLSRHGTISVIQIFVLPLNITYVIDVYRLEDKAFSQPSLTGCTLKEILESAFIPKVFFDVRSDSDALYSLFGINLAGVQDLQLMELATRDFSRKLVSSLAKCIERDAPMTSSEKIEWKVAKEKGRRLFSPAEGGSFEVLNARPLLAEIMQYCVQDVQFLARLWLEYSQRLTPFWASRVEEEVEKRIKDSKSADFNETGAPRSLGPAGWE